MADDPKTETPQSPKEATSYRLHIWTHFLENEFHMNHKIEIEMGLANELRLALREMVQEVTELERKAHILDSRTQKAVSRQNILVVDFAAKTVIREPDSDTAA
jgi:hypothetical protein